MYYGALSQEGSTGNGLVREGREMGEKEGTR